VQDKPRSGSIEAARDERELRQHSLWTIGAGDFSIRATVTIDRFDGRGAGFVFDGGSIALDDAEWAVVLQGRLFGGGSFPFEVSRPPSARPGAPIEIAIERIDGMLIVSMNEFEAGRIGLKGFPLGRIGFDLGGGSMRVLACTAAGDLAKAPRPVAVFTGADGDIDEYRDPAFAVAGDQLLVCAIAVSTRPDGSTSDKVFGRLRNAAGAFATPHPVDIGATTPDVIALGARPGVARPWVLVVQPAAPQRLVEELLLLDSADGVKFEERARIRSTDGPLRIVGGAMQTAGEGMLTVGATRLEQGKPVAVELTLDPSGRFDIKRLSSAPGCDPLRIDTDTLLVRTPGDVQRTVLRGDGLGPSSTTTSSRFEGSASVVASVAAARGELRLAQPDPVFPYPLRELASEDSGATWTRRSTIWGGSAGHTTSIRAGDRVLLLFEGGDKARREHVLFLEIPAPPKAVTTPSGPPTRSP